MSKFQDQPKQDFKLPEQTDSGDDDDDEEVSRYIRRAAANPIPNPSPSPGLFGRAETIRSTDAAGSEPISLMALLGNSLSDSGEEDDDEDEDNEGEEDEVLDRECCVCNVRHKGDAFVPCGHTLCRLCSREMGVESISKGNCPLCNGFILEILNVF